MNYLSSLDIIGIRVDDRDDHADSVQKVLTQYGSQITGRFGIPTPDKEDGLITIVMEADTSEVHRLTNDLLRIEGVVVNSMRV